MILPTDHYIYEGMGDWQAVGETWAERPKQTAEETRDADVPPSALQDYIIWYEDEPTGPCKIASHSPLNAAKDFALRCPHGEQNIVVCARDTQRPDDVHKFQRSEGVWSTLRAPNPSSGGVGSAQKQPIPDSPLAGGTLEALLKNPPGNLKKAKGWILVPMWLGITILWVLLAVIYTMAQAKNGPLAFAFYGSDQFVASVLPFILPGCVIGVILILWLVEKLMDGANWARILFIVGDVLTIIQTLGAFASFGLILALVSASSFLIGALVAVLISIPSIVRLCLLCSRQTSEWFQRVRLLQDERLRASL